MPPSAGSIIHPHFQVFNEDMGSPLLRQNIDAAVAWKAKHGGNFFETLIREEEATDKVCLILTTSPAHQHDREYSMKRRYMFAFSPYSFFLCILQGKERVDGFSLPYLVCSPMLSFPHFFIINIFFSSSPPSSLQRFIGRNEHVVALAPFAPRGANETILYVPGVASIGQLTNEQASSVSDAIIRIVKAYEDIGVGSFNLASFSAPVNAVKEQAEAFTLMFKVSAHDEQEIQTSRGDDNCNECDPVHQCTSSSLFKLLFLFLLLHLLILVFLFISFALPHPPSLLLSSVVLVASVPLRPLHQRLWPHRAHVRCERGQHRPRKLRPMAQEVLERRIQQGQVSRPSCCVGPGNRSLSLIGFFLFTVISVQYKVILSHSRQGLRVLVEGGNAEEGSELGDVVAVLLHETGRGSVLSRIPLVQGWQGRNKNFLPLRAGWRKGKQG